MEVAAASVRCLQASISPGENENRKRTGMCVKCEGFAQVQSRYE